MSYKFIPTKVHGVLDYVVGIALIAAPWLFQFSEVGGAAVAIPVILGIGLIVYSIFTKYELGIVKVLSMPYHLVIDLLAAALLALSPFIFGFYDANSANQWVPHVVVGIAVILVVIFSQTQPANDDVRV
jgi:hypothetical protein